MFQRFMQKDQEPPDLMLSAGLYLYTERKALHGNSLLLEKLEIWLFLAAHDVSGAVGAWGLNYDQALSEFVFKS